MAEKKVKVDPDTGLKSEELLEDSSVDVNPDVDLISHETKASEKEDD